MVHTKQAKQITFLLIATKQTIAYSWKSPVLSFQEVLNCLNGFTVNEKLTAVLEDKYNTFLKVWFP